MDVPLARNKKMPRTLLVSGGIGLLVVLTIVSGLVLSHRSSGIAVDRSTIVTTVARNGPFDRSIVAAGVLASTSVRIVSAIEAGIVENVLVKPGSKVGSGEIIALLQNPDINAAVVDARAALDVAEANLASVRQQGKASALAQQSVLASSQAQMQEDVTTLHSLDSLHRSGLIADTTYRIAKIKVAQSHRQVEIALSQVSVDNADRLAKIAAARAQVDEAAAQLSTKEAAVEALFVRAGAPGIVQSVTIEPGARVDVGTRLATVAGETGLKAVLQVAESQVHEIMVGMEASVDTRNGVVIGHVARIAPSATNGNVAVEVTFDHPLPSGARPELNVDGTIGVQRISHAISIDRPAGAIDNTSVDLYRVDQNDSNARLVKVRLGRGSANRVQVLSGLKAGDTVIISDTSIYNGQSILRLH